LLLFAVLGFRLRRCLIARVVLQTNFIERDARAERISGVGFLYVRGGMGHGAPHHRIGRGWY
jgi:hypothetical protein